jgi:hypothetical protein
LDNANILFKGEININKYLWFLFSAALIPMNATENNRKALRGIFHILDSLFWMCKKIAVIKVRMLLIDQPLDTFCVNKIGKDKKSGI